MKVNLSSVWENWHESHEGWGWDRHKNLRSILDLLSGLFVIEHPCSTLIFCFLGYKTETALIIDLLMLLEYRLCVLLLMGQNYCRTLCFVFFFFSFLTWRCYRLCSSFPKYLTWRIASSEHLSFQMYLDLLF